MKQVWVLAVVLATGMSSAAAEPTAAPPPPAIADTAAAPAPAAAPADTGVKLAADTLVRIELAEAVGSHDRKRGDKFAIRLAAPIVIDGKTVAPAGATGQGEVVYAEKGGGGGAPGKLVLAARYIDVGSVRVKLKAFKLGSGAESEVNTMEVAAQLIGPAVMFINGKEVLYPIGTRAAAKIAEDVVFPPIASGGAATTTPSPSPTASAQEPAK